MALDTILPLACACGNWRGTFSAIGRRTTCYCDDCQTYARFLGRNDTLDPAGGTEVIQTWPSRISVTAGAGELRLMRLSPKGLHRWFAGCCRAPIGNTFGNARFPFVGLMVARIGVDRREDLSKIFGPAVGVQGRFAPGGCPPGVLPSANPSVIGGAVLFLARGWLRGAHRPSIFFSHDGAPAATAQILDAPSVIKSRARARARHRSRAQHPAM